MPEPQPYQTNPTVPPLADPTGALPTQGKGANAPVDPSLPPRPMRLRPPAGLTRPARDSWLDRAQRAVAADRAPTWSLDLRAIHDGVEAERARAVIDVATRIAESMLSTGASAADVTATVLRLTDAYGLRSVHVDVTFTAIAVSHHRGAEDPVTLVRTVKVRSADYDRLARLQDLVSRIERDTIPIADARSEFEEIAGRPHPYRRSLVTLSAAVMGASLCLLLGGTPLTIAIGTISAVLVDRAQLWAARRGLAAFFAQILGGAIPTLLALALTFARTHDVPGLGGVSPYLIVAAGIVGLLAGLSVVGAAQDAIDGYYVTAGARSFEVVVLTLGIIVGIVFIIDLGTRLGAPTQISPKAALADDLLVQFIAVALISASFAFTAYASPRTVVVSIVVGVAGWAVYAAAIAVGLRDPATSAFAALAVGVLSQVLAGVCRVPSLALSTAGIVALLPGLMVYRGLYQVTAQPLAVGYGPGLVTLASAAAIGLALAAGVSLGTFLGRPLRWDRQPTTPAHRTALRRASADGKE